MISGGKGDSTGESEVFTGAHNQYLGDYIPFIGERVTNIKTRTVKHLKSINDV
ncbi:hypothetical protein JYA63_10410 [Fictibacillus nanhaiensis]|uniref:Uncharacterized protein n=1 Tax=Fictibacillus nanhaiensis TaxID=742169 RepID=A0ABS2ZRM6_9BACL|nr:hypothetical protein [Fictibacillus nanhaiensis]